MTPQKCIALAQGRRYSGVFFDTCYGSESLEATTFVQGTGCSIPCPGDPTQICGGNAAAVNGTRLGTRHLLRPRLLKRAAPPNVLLTIYEIAIVLPGSTVISSGVTVEVPPTTIVGQVVTVPGPNVVVSIPATVAVSGPPTGAIVLGGPNTIVPPVVTVVTTRRVFVTQLANASGQGALTSLRSPVAGMTSVVTTITYTTIDPARPTALIPVELGTTLYFEDCHCPTQVIPTVTMAPYVAQCDKCGENGRSIVILAIPMDLNPNNRPAGVAGNINALASLDMSNAPNTPGQVAQGGPIPNPNSQGVNPGLGNPSVALDPTNALPKDSGPSRVVVAGAQGVRYSNA
ncbi:uncharacterized protein CTRU02_208584 [Colletotrichum truncatum]|uniref:Uncharacterized protein n=1 Tax=Colletotrichum truncatum TaxID=5467 RepID=A0ACC3YWW1_COLTU|nr:uncharacterized protein CTRU02_10338 [Colletotrichum truncatum]KAF6787542.1 hypothetical protein CTRU02_10338 [Colletotrichum truncatum]